MLPNSSGGVLASRVCFSALREVHVAFPRLKREGKVPSPNDIPVKNKR
jgi:hypothetical protein